MVDMVRVKNMKKRLSDGTLKNYSCNSSFRKIIEVKFENDSCKIQFDNKFAKVKEMIGKDRKNSNLLDNLLDYYIDGHTFKTNIISTVMEFPTKKNDNIYEHEELYIGEIQKIIEFPAIIEEHSRTCVHGLAIKDIRRTGHVIELTFICNVGLIIKWPSSESINNNYLVNYTIGMACICSGMMSLQYKKKCKFRKIGLQNDRFIFENCNNAFNNSKLTKKDICWNGQERRNATK